MLDILGGIIASSWMVVGQMAPYLLFGFLVAGVLSVLVNPERVERHLGGRGLLPVVKASLFGVPLPLCSCGVIPVSASLRRHGSSRGATAAFLISTPQTGVDSIAVTYALLGPVFAVFRPLLAFVTGVAGGAAVDTFVDGNSPEEVASEAAACTDSCCAKDKKHENTLTRILHYGFVTLPGDIGPALLIGVIVAGAMTALVPKDALAVYVGGGIVSILVMMAAGIPIYVCSTASVSVAAGFLHMGVSPGAVLAFLIAGPATNAATISTIWKVLGRRTAIIYLSVIALSAVGGGLLLDWLRNYYSFVPTELSSHAHEMEAMPLIDHVWALLLIAVTIPSYFTRYLRSADHGIGVEEAKEKGDEKVVLRISGMHCSHCAESICRALLEQDGVEEAEVLLLEKEAVIFGKNLDVQKLLACVRGLGYGAEE